MRSDLSLGSRVLPLLLLIGCAATPPEQDPVVQRMTEMDGRLLRIERVLSNQSLLEQSQRVESLVNDVRALRGQIEQMQHAQDSARNQQRELYADLDRRLQAVESRGAAAAALTPGGATAAPAGDDDAAAYKKAFDMLKEGK
jgi:TolA-binding protein